ncbi:acyl-CoA thioesterase II [Alloalcanivorax sp. C16-2]|uniref:acyl-CoA thioesterase II n=1 Tax=Alloalcanivorax TaxID=3020832 RepID=UPI0019319A47|nr:acyl-CoA thioesterase II [Alloalcanivorax marinus]MBL7250186.1 acyl-CoA thioesterase II [Alloalcanivorax marinus]
MKEAVRELMQRFSLEPLEDNLFRGQSEANGQRSIFGGLVAGQSLLAASMTVPEDRPVHSLHAYFLRPGDIRRPVIYDVDRIRDGKSFTTRRVNAIQHGRPIFSLAASFQVEEEGARHQAPMPEVPAPDELETDEQARLRMAERIPKQFRDDFLRQRPLTFRPVTPRDAFESESREPVKRFWFKVADEIQADRMTQRALLAYCSDYGFMGTAMQPHGMTFWQSNVQCASLDHTMWFYEDFRVDDWLLYDCLSPGAAGARGLTFGNIYRRDGVLVASVAQEGLMRLRPGEELV